MRELPARIRDARSRAGERPESNRRVRITALTALGLATLAVLGVVSAASGEGEVTSRGAGFELLDEGVELNDAGSHRKAIRSLKGGMLELGGRAPERVLAKANFELGVALRRIGKFEAAEKPLNRSRLFGISSARVGVQLAKARARIRG